MKRPLWIVLGLAVAVAGAAILGVEDFNALIGCPEGIMKCFGAS